jgi:SAM-dependent methyltransferase
VNQHEYWNGPVAAHWAECQERRERCFAKVTEAVLDFAALKPGMTVLDVGCGSGATTDAIARSVAPGKAVGIDISATLLAAAKDKQGEFLEADAATQVFADKFDLIFSRFGVMFFADPVAAFANLRQNLKPGGRLAFVCWCPLRENPFHNATYTAARDLLPPQPAPVPHAPGPFGLDDPVYSRSILEQAGWNAIRIVRLETQALMGTTLSEAMDEAMNLGPLAAASRTLAEPQHELIRQRITPVLQRYETPQGVLLPASFWLVAAAV